MPRVEFDDWEGIFFDTTKPIAGPDGQCDERGQLYSECDPVDVCAELEKEIADLKSKLRAKTYTVEPCPGCAERDVKLGVMEKVKEG